MGQKKQKILRFFCYSPAQGPPPRRPPFPFEKQKKQKNQKIATFQGPPRQNGTAKNRNSLGFSVFLSRSGRSVRKPSRHPSAFGKQYSRTQKIKQNGPDKTENLGQSGCENGSRYGSWGGDHLFIFMFGVHAQVS